MKLLRSFIKGKMNKSVDQRLLPPGEYVDARNIRVGNTELTDIGSIEKTKGNSRLTTLQYSGANLSTSAICIGAFEDGANDTLYWFVHDPANTTNPPVTKVDMIVSYNVNSGTLTYHVISDNNGTTNTALNFNPTYLINAIDKIENLIFFTDNYNEPRRFDITRTYASTITDTTHWNVIKKPPVFAPTFELFNQNSEINYLEDKFISFAYRWKYREGEYSSLSPFTQVAFEPKEFRLNTDNYTNDGMLNRFNAVKVDLDTGGAEVLEIELCFKYGDDNFVRIAERLNKAELGYGNNVLLSSINKEVVFDNSKTYTFLPESEVSRLYDNVPRLAQAQTILGNRLMYGNYLEGYNLTTTAGNEVSMDYTLNYNGNPINFNSFSETYQTGNVQVLAGTTASLSNQTVTFDLSGTSFTTGTQIYFRIDVEHGGWFNLKTAIPALPATPTNVGSGSFSIELTYTVPQYYATVFDFASSTEFQDAVGTISNIQTALLCANGGTWTDVFNCNINANPSSDWTLSTTGYLSPLQSPIGITTTPGANTIGFTILAANFTDTTGSGYASPGLAEYFQITNSSGYSSSIGSLKSLHSDRNYEVAIEYLDEFGRASTALASGNNSIYVPCVGSRFSNRISVNIPPSQQAPSWAKYYRFLMKQDRFNYQTIYTTNWYNETGTNANWMQLEGENQQKVEVGDFFRPKADVKGAIGSCCTTEVLDKVSQERNFLTGDTRASTADPVIISEDQGVYMKLKPDCFSTDKSDFVEYTNGIIDVNSKSDRSSNGIGDGGNSKDYLYVDYQVYDQVGATITRWPVNEGAQVEIFIDVYRGPQKKCKDTCGARQTLLDVSITSSADYTNLKEFFEGEGLVAQWQNSPDQTIECIDDAGSGTATYYPALATGTGSPGSFAIDSTANTYVANPNNNGIQFYTVGTYLLMRVIGGYAFCNNRKKDNQLRVMVKITENPNVVAFETTPIDANIDLYYEGAETYRIDADGNHLGFGASAIGDTPENSDVNQNISTNTSALINLSFFNCYVFGNGIESFRILDSLSKQFFLLGSRTNIVIADDYKEIRRFSDITYSGTYQDEQNVNRLNEFNLSLGNYKICEQAFGDIQVIDARTDDMLVLQEDKISYVLVGKNLLSDATGGGNVASVPEVLGNQITRVEKYGISSNPESYIQWGAEKFFTDAKRGVVLKLEGIGRQENLSVISAQGMDSWFRDLFQGAAFFTQKLGGYDPYMDEYILHSNDTDLPLDEPCEECGGEKNVTVAQSKIVQFCVDYGTDVGTVDIPYNVTSGEAQITVTYDGGTTTGAATTGPATLSFSKSSPTVQTATIKITGIATTSEVSVSYNCVTSTSLTVVMVCLSSDIDSTKTIHNEYNYKAGSIYFPKQSTPVVLASGTLPLVSQYTKIPDSQGAPNIPTDGSSVLTYANRISPDSFIFDPAVNGFKWLRSATLYPNTSVGIANLLAAAAPITPLDTTDAPQVYKATIPTLPAGGEYLYLIYDYRKSTSLSLCYGATAFDACCLCDTCEDVYPMQTSNGGDRGALCPVSGAISNTYYYEGDGISPKVGDRVWLDAAGSTVLPAAQWYKLDDATTGDVIYVVTQGGFSIIQLKQTC